MVAISTQGGGLARGYRATLAARYSGRHGEDGDVDVSVILITHQVHQERAGTPSTRRTNKTPLFLTVTCCENE